MKTHNRLVSALTVLIGVSISQLNYSTVFMIALCLIKLIRLQCSMGINDTNHRHYPRVYVGESMWLSLKLPVVLFTRRAMQMALKFLMWVLAAMAAAVVLLSSRLIYSHLFFSLEHRKSSSSSSRKHK
jgi:hypothetical protein